MKESRVENNSSSMFWITAVALSQNNDSSVARQFLAHALHYAKKTPCIKIATIPVCTSLVALLLRNDLPYLQGFVNSFNLYLLDLANFYLRKA